MSEQDYEAAIKEVLRDVCGMGNYFKPKFSVNFAEDKYWHEFENRIRNLAPFIEFDEIEFFELSTGADYLKAISMAIDAGQNDTSYLNEDALQGETHRIPQIDSPY